MLSTKPLTNVLLLYVSQKSIRIFLFVKNITFRFCHFIIRGCDTYLYISETELDKRHNKSVFKVSRHSSSYVTSAIFFDNY